MYIIFKTKTPASVFILDSSLVEFPEQDQAISYWNYSMHVSIEKSGETFTPYCRDPKRTSLLPEFLENFFQTSRGFKAVFPHRDPELLRSFGAV